MEKGLSFREMVYTNKTLKMVLEQLAIDMKEKLTL